MVIGIIPARKGSARLKGKNKKLLGGKPLIKYIVEEALQSKKLSKVILTTDDEEILDMCSHYQDLILIKRPNKLAESHSPARDYVIHALDHINRECNYFCILQPTSPFTLASDIDNAINLIYEKKCESVVSVMKVDHAIHPVKLKRIKGSKLLPMYEDEADRMADHELDDVYARNCSIYLSNIEVLEKYKKNVLGKDVHCLIMPRERSIDINDNFDFMLAEFMLQQRS